MEHKANSIKEERIATIRDAYLPLKTSKDIGLSKSAESFVEEGI